LAGRCSLPSTPAGGRCGAASRRFDDRSARTGVATPAPPGSGRRTTI
jgi:hypothetical protein